MTITLLLNNLKLNFLFFGPLAYTLSDQWFNFTDFTVSYRDALDRLRVRLNVILFDYRAI